MISREIIIKLADKAWMEPIYRNDIFPPSVYYRFMKLLAREVQPQISVVLGVCGGGDCLHLLEGHKHKVFGIDIAWDHPIQISHIHSVHGDDFSFLNMDSVQASIAFDPNSVDILFIDTTHTYEQTMLEHKIWRDKVRQPGGIILFDDLYRNGMEQAWNEIPGEKIRRDDLHIGGAPDEGGFGIVLI